MRSASQLVERLTVEVYTKSIGRWFDSGCWDLHFFLRGRGPRPTFCSETETRSNGAYWYSKWNLVFYSRLGLLYASEDCHGPWRRVLGACGLRDERDQSLMSTLHNHLINRLSWRTGIHFLPRNWLLHLTNSETNNQILQYLGRTDRQETMQQKWQQTDGATG